MSLKLFGYEKSVEKVSLLSEGPVIFLAGPTVRKSQPHLTSWRPDCINEFAKRKFGGSLIIPEYMEVRGGGMNSGDIVQWEFDGLHLAHCILFWIPRTPELIGLTTNFEIGYWIARNQGKIVYGRPENAHRIGYVDAMWKISLRQEGRDRPIYRTLEDTVEAAILIAKTAYDTGRFK